MIRVAIADDHAIVRAGLRALIGGEADMTLVAEACDGLAALEAGKGQGVDVFLVDLSLPGMDGVEVIAKLRAACPQTRVLVLSMHASAEFVRPALRAGALGYLVKGAGLDDLLPAIRAVHRGERFVDPAAASALQGEQQEEGDAVQRLTPREREVWRMVAQGHTNRSMALALGLSPKTVDSHRSNLMRKLGVHDVQGLTRLAVRRGLVDG